MAIVRNLADASGSTDRPYRSPRRANAGDPNGAITPAYAGEIISDTTNKKRWIADGLLNTLWTPIEATFGV